ncbi:hypothetical protein Patl1_01521 [Pistacia atlantica]|uniref:Uncharacterized protein n=1 Tax=Pistacia atlantica TaxID=434234 RepID=A0ACC1C7C7_9ROSI|nr:hypothetical protein Patl1_01521 [Pistacia atlantica]
MGLAHLFLFAFILLFSVSSARISGKVGICYGQLGDNLPSPSDSVKLIQSLKATRVKIYDANPKILKALKNTDIQASIMLPNNLIVNISSSQTLADKWVQKYVLPYYSDTKIRYLLIGNEILSAPDNLTWSSLVPAMRKIRHSLKTLGAPKIKVGTPLAMDVLQSSFPPSNGTFRSDVSDSIMKPMLQFLNRTKSFFFVDVYTYFPWISDPKNINLDYALLQASNITYTDPVTNLTYTNLFDQMVDALVFAMRRLGYPDIRIWIAETGWPNGGDYDQIGANIYNAATYNRNIVKKLTARPPIGTPARPGWVIPSFIFSLYNENQKPGPGTERHFGLLYPNKTNVYEIDLSGETPTKVYKPGNKTCDPLQPGKACSKPDSLEWHASYAFSSYWAQFKRLGGSCYFNGLATQTIKDPSHGSCKFPSVTL